MKTDKWLFYFVSILIAIGIVFSLSLTSYTVLVHNYSNHLHFFILQFCVGMFCVFLMWIVSRLDPDKFLTPIGISLFLLMFFTMFFMNFLPPSMVTEINGAARWIKLPGFSLAPVEFFKVGFIYFLAWSFNRKLDYSKKSIATEIATLLPYLVLFSVIVILIGVYQNDLGQVVVLSLVLLLMSMFAGTSFRLIGLSAVGIIFAAWVFIVTSDHRIERVKSWWGGVQDVALSMPFVSPEAAAKLRIEDAVTPYQVGHSLNAINNGEVFGKGLGQGSFKLGYLSEVHTDFVLAGIAEEIGFVGILLITLLFYAILFRIFQIASKSENKVNYLFCLGVGFMFLFSFIMNSYGITSISPVKGIAVPFLSYGGSHLLAASFAIGLVLMASKKAKI